MSSVFIAFCFVKTGFTSNPESLITNFEKNSIVLMIGRYVFHEKIEYISLIQTVPIFFQADSSCTPEDLSYAFSLLIYSAPAVTNSYKSNNNIGRQSFMLSEKLYNAITGQKGIDSNVIVFYANINGHYDSLKDSLKKTVLSVIGRFKVSSQSKIPYIISSEIEWSYVARYDRRTICNDELSRFQQVKKRSGPFASPSTSSHAKPSTVDLTNLTDQIRENNPVPDSTSSNQPALNQPLPDHLPSNQPPSNHLLSNPSLEEPTNAKQP
ncbi:hypothetical protein C2G38_2228372 [Gigaspora rosea]|uniref:Uncharacterized protein n=1 Tax=Gigaspora rosea TaxID=44941 RepID=A0A397TW00_9GLOM|nr:hypothetical protein C2G38_2228372 [Gigaspora rosea]